MKEKIVIVDDEPDIVELVTLHLNKNSYIVKSFLNARCLFSYLSKEIPDLIILDIMLPDMDGIEICKKIRNDPKLKNIPIIMLTAKLDETDIILGLEFGADDYVTKPFSPKQLMARVKAVLRRYIENNENSNKKQVINIDNRIIIDLQKYSVTDENGKEIELTNTEFKILQFLSNRRGWVLSRDKLLSMIWGEEKYVIDRTIDVHIKHLREKLGSAGDLIKNVRGVGYKIEE